MADQTPKDPAGAFAGFEATPIRIHVRVGAARCTLGRLAELDAGDVIPLDRAIGEPLELRGGGILIGQVEPVAEAKGVAVKLVRIAGDDDDGR